MLPLLLLDEFISPRRWRCVCSATSSAKRPVTEQLYEILPIGAPIVMMVLSLLFCALQAIVFTTLVSIYLQEATE